MTPPFRELFDQAIEHMIPQAHRMGVRAVELAPGRAVCTVPLEGNGNHLGSMYAGVLFTVAEVLGGAICLPSFDLARFYPVVKDVRIGFRRAARSDVRAEAVLAPEVVEHVRALAEAEGKAPFTLSATLTDTEGQVVATTEGTYQLRAYGAAG